MHPRGTAFSLLAAFYWLLSAIDGKYQRTVTYDSDILVRCPYGVAERMIAETAGKRASLDVWKLATDGNSVHLRMPEEAYGKAGTEGCDIVDNVERLVQRSERRIQSHAEEGWFEQYHNYTAIIQWWQELATDNPGLVRVRVAGMSLEGRVQPAIHISGDAASPPRFKILLVCSIYAREWISASACMYVADFLARNYFEADVRGLMDNLEFIVLPLANPDGYEYTWTTDRLWTKNRRGGRDCYGVDLNLNFPYHWGEAGSSGRECSELYRGTSAGSEAETQNIVKYFRGNGPILGVIEFYSNHQQILRPWSWTSVDCPDEPFLKELGDVLASVASSAYGTMFKSKKASDVYNASGTACDWFYSSDATMTNGGYRAASYAVEMRDDGEYGFLLPPDQIVPAGNEMVQVVLEFSRYVLTNPIPAQS